MINVSLTSRIVGAIVLLSLGIIFIPVLLETNKIDGGNMGESPIPDIPSEISTIVFQLNDETGEFEQKGESPAAQFERQVDKEIANSAREVELPDLTSDPVIAAPAEQKTAQSSEKKSQEKITQKVKVTEKVTEKAPKDSGKSRHSWMLQVASFKDVENALKLRDKLRAQHYVTHVEERKQGATRIWRVRIGPDLDKSKIQKIQATLDKEMGLRGLIVQRR